MMSAFLLVYGLLTAERVPNFTSYAIRRALRLLPSISVLLLAGYLLGDCWELPFRELDHSASISSRMATILLLANNYFDQSKYGSLTASLAWSCAADFQMSLIVFLIVTYFRRLSDPPQSPNTIAVSTSVTPPRVVLAQRLKYVFILLIVLSLIIRGVIFDKDTRNLMKLVILPCPLLEMLNHFCSQGQYSHMGLMMTNSSYQWMQAHYGHIWHTTNDALALSQEYLSALYMPTHSRFGPFAVGGFLACTFYTSLQDIPSQASQKQWSLGNLFWFIIRWILTGICAMLLVLPCLPPPPIGNPSRSAPFSDHCAEESPIESQLITTMAFRTLAATAAAFMLYRSILPSSHPSSWPALSSVLSFPPFQFLASISFCSYLVHFRLLMELILNPSVRAITGLTLPSVLVSESTPLNNLVNEWILFIALNGLLAIVLSTLLSSVFHYGFENPMTTFVKRIIDGSSSSPRRSPTEGVKGGKIA
jgi:peptidoglycan/LPS O-acetylase OafA/YrhL